MKTKVRKFFKEAAKIGLTMIVVIVLHGIMPILFVEFYLLPLVEKYQYVIQKIFLGDYIIFTTLHYSIFAIIIVAVASKVVVSIVELKIDRRFKYFHITDL